MRDGESQKQVISPQAEGLARDMEGIFAKFMSQKIDVIEGGKTGAALKSPDKEIAVYGFAITQMLTFVGAIRATLSDEEIEKLIDSINANSKLCANLFTNNKEREKHNLNTAKAEAAFKGFAMAMDGSGGDAEKLKLFGITLDERTVAWDAIKSAMLSLNGKHISQAEYANKLTSMALDNLKSKGYSSDKLEQFEKFIAQGKAIGRDLEAATLNTKTGKLETVKIAEAEKGYVKQKAQVAIPQFIEIFNENSLNSIQLLLNKRKGITEIFQGREQKLIAQFSEFPDDSIKIINALTSGTIDQTAKEMLDFYLQDPAIFSAYLVSFSAGKIDATLKSASKRRDFLLYAMEENLKDHNPDGAKIFAIIAYGNKEKISKKPEVLDAALKAAENPEAFQKLVLAYYGKLDAPKPDEELRKIAQSWRDNPKQIAKFMEFYNKTSELYNDQNLKSKTAIEQLKPNQFTEASIKHEKNKTATLICKIVGQDRFNNIHLAKMILDDPNGISKLPELEKYWQKSLGVKSSEKLYEALNKDQIHLKNHFGECLNYSADMWQKISQRAAAFKLDMRKEEDWQKLNKIAKLEYALANNKDLTDSFKEKVIDPIVKQAAKSGNFAVLDIAIEAAKYPDNFKAKVVDLESKSYDQSISKKFFHKDKNAFLEYGEEKFTKSLYYKDVIKPHLFGKDALEKQRKADVQSLSAPMPKNLIETTFLGKEPIAVQKQEAHKVTPPLGRS